MDTQKGIPVNVAVSLDTMEIIEFGLAIFGGIFLAGVLLLIIEYKLLK